MKQTTKWQEQSMFWVSQTHGRKLKKQQQQQLEKLNGGTLLGKQMAIDYWQVTKGKNSFLEFIPYYLNNPVIISSDHKLYKSLSIKQN